MTAKFTVCCLFFGEYHELAERLLRSLSRPWVGLEFRFGLNRVGERTSQAVQRFIETSTAPCSVYHGREPYWKYPLMRQMFQGLNTPYTMWFDDDSWIDDYAPDDIFSRIQEKLQDHDIVGAPYYKFLIGGQQAFVKAQPWYNHRPVDRKVVFITGGWFAIKTEILQKHDWPPANFEHNGGDVMLGALCKQYGYKLGKFTEGLHINAKPDGGCSSSPRRGFSQQPIGIDFVESDAPPQRVEEAAPARTFFDILDGK